MRPRKKARSTTASLRTAGSSPSRNTLRVNVRGSAESPSGSSPARRAAATRRASASGRRQTGTKGRSRRAARRRRQAPSPSGRRVVRDGVGHQVRTPEGSGAAAAVQRIGAEHGVTHGQHTRSHGHTIDDVVAPTVQQAGHHVHLLGDRIGSAVEPGRGGDQLPRTLVEHCRVGQHLAQLVVGCWRCERDTERAVVAHEDAVLEEAAQIAADGAGAGRVVVAVAQPVEAAEVDDAGVVDLFGDGAGPIAAYRSPSALRRPAATTVRSASMVAPSAWPEPRRRAARRAVRWWRAGRRHRRRCGTSRGPRPRQRGATPTRRWCAGRRASPVRRRRAAVGSR